MRHAVIYVLLAAAACQAQPAGDAASRARQAAEFVIQGKLDDAIATYKGLLEEFPGRPEILLNLSIAEFKAGRYADAAGHAAAAVQAAPQSPAANLFLGSSYVQLGQFERAVAPLEKVAATQPGDRNARIMLGEAYLNCGRPGDAAAQFRKLTEISPESSKAWYGLARAYEALSGRASQELERRHAESPYWHALAGDGYLRQRRNGKAFREYRLALAASAPPPGLHASLARVYARTGHPEWAEIEKLREEQAPAKNCAVQQPACDFSAGQYERLAQAKESTGTAESLYWAVKAYSALAGQSYQKLLALPPSLEAHLHKAAGFDGQGRYREASEEWRAALSMQGASRHVRISLAWSLFRAGEYNAALPVLKDLLGTDADSSELNFLYGSSLLNMGQPEKAFPILEKSVRLDGKFLPAHAALGQALLVTGKPSAAIPHLRAALPGNGGSTVHFQLVRCYQLTNQPEQAARELAEYRKARDAAERERELEEGGAISAP